MNSYKRDRIFQGPSKRWQLNDIELTCGDGIEVCIEGYWIYVTIEHSDGEYVFYPSCIRIENGMLARFIYRSRFL